MTATIAEPTTRRRQATVHRLPRRVPRPVSEPPFDDERTAGVLPTSTQGSLALDLRRDAVTADDEWRQAHRLSVVPTMPVRPAVREDEEEDRFFARQRTEDSDLPAPKPFCGRYVQALIEVLAGERPVIQLMRWTSDEIYQMLLERVQAITQAGGGSGRGAGRLRATVCSVHVQRPSNGVAEASVHVRHAGQSRAVALRLEGLDGHWRCTALQLG